MKNFNLKKLHPFLLILVTIISIENLIGQVTNPIFPNDTQAYATGGYGPTLIIASGLPYAHTSYDNDGNQYNTYDYMHSKAYYYGINNQKYRFTLVNYTATNLVNDSTESITPLSLTYSQIHENYNDNINANLPRFQYLDAAIKAALDGGFRRIIILEGEYQVNNTIVIDNIRQTPNAKAIGKITIEGEGFGTRITNAPTYLTGAIFQIKSGYNTLKNMSIIS